jgi:hypothetical protein
MYPLYFYSNEIRTILVDDKPFVQYPNLTSSSMTMVNGIPLTIEHHDPLYLVLMGNIFITSNVRNTTYFTTKLLQTDMAS